MTVNEMIKIDINADFLPILINHLNKWELSSTPSFIGCGIELYSNKNVVIIFNNNTI